MVNICEESKLSLTITSNGRSRFEDNNDLGNHSEVTVDSGYAHPTLDVPMVDSFQAHHIHVHGEADSVNARQTQGEDKAHPP